MALSVAPKPAGQPYLLYESLEISQNKDNGALFDF